MAKLMATFEMQDRISPKLRGLYTNLAKVESTTEAASKALGHLDKAQARPILLVIDTATGTVRTLQKDMDRLHQTKAKPTLSADDKASAVTDKVKKNVESVGKAKGTAAVTAADTATGITNKARKNVEAMDDAKGTATITATDEASSVIENIQAKLEGLQNAALTITAAGGLVGANAVSQGSSVMEQNARTAATTGMSYSGVNSYVNDIFYNQKAGNSREEVAMSLQNIAQQTDLSGKGLKDAVMTSNQIAQLYQKDVPEVDRALGSMIKNFNMDSVRAGDNLAYVFKNAGDQYDDLLDTFQEYSSSFVDMQMAPEQVSAAFVAGTKGGARNFDVMADSMREFNIRRNEMSEDQVAAFKKLLGADEAKKMFDGFAKGTYTGQEAMFRLANGLSEITDETDRAAIATTLIGTQYEDLKQPILDMAGAIDQPAKATGELNKQFDAMRNNNPMTPIRDTGREVESILVAMGTTILTSVAPAFEDLHAWMKSTEGQEAIKNTATTIGDMAETFSEHLVPAVKFAAEHFDTLGPPLIAGALLIGGLTTASLVLAPALTGLIGTVALLKKGMGLFNKSNPAKGLDDATESMSRMERKAKDGAKSTGTLTSKLKDLFKVKAPKDSPLFGGGATKRGGAAKAGAGSKLGGLAKGAGRVLLPAGILMGAYDIFTSSAGQERNRAIGGTIGGLGGGWGGAAAGASLGTLVAPGIGTVLGGLAGGAAGYLGGDKLGSWIGGLFGGGQKEAAQGSAQSGSMTAGVEKELKALSEKGSAYGKAFATNFSTGLNNTAVSITTWLSSKVYAPMGNAATSANHFGYTFSYGFVSGLNTAPINVTSWLSEKVYTPMGNAATSANHFGYAFSYGFANGLNTAPINLTTWLMDKVYAPMGDAAKSANHFGYAFSTGFMMGLGTGTLNMDVWISANIYQPLNSAAAGARPYGSALVYNFKEGIKAIPVGMSVWLKNHVETPMREFVPKAMDWGSGMIGYFVTGMNRQGSNVSETAKNLASRVEEAFRSELGIHSPSRVMADLGYWSAMGVVKGFSGVDVTNIAKSKADELMMAFGGNYGGGGAAMAQQAITQALMMLGKPMSLLGPLMKIADKESSFNPNARNDWDINAQRGDPSIGLFQIIGSTFARWKYPGANDRTNPLHSALAAIRYMDGRYGGVMNHPGIKNMAKGGGYLPYAKGGIITHDHIARVGEQGKKEVIIPLEQHRNRALGLLDYAQQALGVSSQPQVTLAGGISEMPVESGAVTLPEEETQTIQSVMNRTVQTVKSGLRDVVVQIMGDSHYHNEMDAETVGKIAVTAVERKLEEEYFTGGEMAVYD